MDILGKIKEIKYTPTMCSQLLAYPIDQLRSILSMKGAFKLKLDGDYFAVSRWVSAKRTRSYPYARVYDTLGFTGKKITVIPIYKDEGFDGDRDFLQYDTISLMSLLGVYVIIAYYNNADKNLDYENKITNQEFDHNFIRDRIMKIASYYSDALHWNMTQLEQVANIGECAIKSYSNISRTLGVKMHLENGARKKIDELASGLEIFRDASRSRGINAQYRESKTIQPKESLEGEKATITITNFYNGFYPFTVDEAVLDGTNLCLVEAKHTSHGALPSLEDIKDGILKMIIFTNLSTVTVNQLNYNSVPALKLTTASQISYNDLDIKSKAILDKVKNEANINNFKVIFNGQFI